MQKEKNISTQEVISMEEYLNHLRNNDSLTDDRLLTTVPTADLIHPSLPPSLTVWRWGC